MIVWRLVRWTHTCTVEVINRKNGNSYSYGEKVMMVAAAEEGGGDYDGSDRSKN